MYVNNHSYNAPGQKDDISFTVLDLTEAQNPYLRFDVSYARFNQTYTDELLVEVSTDCKENFNNSIYQKNGNQLATTSNTMTGWVPTSPEHWRTEIIDLSQFIGNKIALRFTNICGFGNNLYIDNIVVYEYNTYPQASFSVFPDERSICVGESLIFNNTSFGDSIDSFQWHFGENAFPSSSDFPGPHTVTFDEPGVYEISLYTSNSLGWDKTMTPIEVIDLPVSDFSYEINDGVVQFINNSTFGTDYYWDFGDGNISLEKNPSHAYFSNNIYPVTLTVTNKCGEQSILYNISITTSSKELKESFDISINPNPTNQFVNVEWLDGHSQDYSVEFFDINGKKIKEFQFLNISKNISKRLNISDLANGMYILKIHSKKNIVIEKLLVF